MLCVHVRIAVWMSIYLCVVFVCMWVSIHLCVVGLCECPYTCVLCAHVCAAVRVYRHLCVMCTYVHIQLYVCVFAFALTCFCGVCASPVPFLASVLVTVPGVALPGHADSQPPPSGPPACTWPASCVLQSPDTGLGRLHPLAYAPRQPQ